MPRNTGRRAVSDSQMSAAVRPMPLYGLPALGISLLLHGSLVAVPVLVGLHLWTPPRAENESVAMLGSSIEVDAPTEQLATTPAAQAEEQEVEVEPAAAPEPNAETDSEPAPDTPRPKPAPAPAPKPKPKTETPRPKSESSSGSSEAPVASAAAPGTFGAEGLKPGVRRLGYAFARAIPAYTPT